MIDDYLLMRRTVLLFYTRRNWWLDYHPHEEGVLHGMADCWSELAMRGAAE